jgi:hypothetical protein
MRRLSRRQLEALRCADQQPLLVDDVNGGNGNRRRTYLSLMKLGLLGHDPILRGRLALTPAGKEQLR